MKQNPTFRTKLIQYQPRYNILLKMTRAIIKITKEETPKLIVTRTVKRTGKYFGPYPIQQQRDKSY